jgi:peptidoglycan/LPS O-acetylase OafA/YrhL
MRAAAIIYVMLSHGYAYSADLLSAGYYRWLILDGVGLFFVLSGFLIGGILIRSANAGNFGIRQLGDFWIRRWLRTLPAYLCVLTLLIGCYYTSHRQLPPVWIKYYFFTQNFSSPHPLFFAEAWSLSVEEWFYLLVPLGLLFILTLPGQRQMLLLAGILAVLIAVTCARVYKVSHHDYFTDGTFGTHVVKVVLTRMDAIMYGVLGAWLSIYHERRFYAHKGKLLVAGLALLICCNIPTSLYFISRIKYTLVPLATLCLLPALSSLRKGQGRVAGVITFISIISYSMYLTNHMIVQRGMMPFVTKWLALDPGNAAHSIAAYVLFWTLTIAASYVLYRLVEKPFMDFRRKFAPVEAGVETGSAPNAVSAGVESSN